LEEIDMSEKEKTNRKWTSSDKYRNNYDAIFGKKEKAEDFDVWSEEQKEFNNSVITEAQEKAMQELVEATEEMGLYPWKGGHKPDHEDRLSAILDDWDKKAVEFKKSVTGQFIESTYRIIKTYGTIKK